MMLVLYLVDSMSLVVFTKIMRTFCVISSYNALVNGWQLDFCIRSSFFWIRVQLAAGRGHNTSHKISQQFCIREYTHTSKYSVVFLAVLNESRDTVIKAVDGT
jgi:hypothetical protein